MENIEQDYYINKLGEIFSKKRHKQRKLKLSNCNGYSIVCLHVNGKQKNEYVHRLVAKTYIPNPDNRKEVNHINGIKTDNRVENLEWCTAKENTNHAVSMGLRNNKGENNYLSKLTEEQVLLIRADYRSQREIAKDYKVTDQIIGRIKRRQTWNHI